MRRAHLALPMGFITLAIRCGMLKGLDSVAARQAVKGTVNCFIRLGRDERIIARQQLATEATVIR